MKETGDIIAFYQARVSDCGHRIATFQARERWLAWGRLLVVIATGTAVIASWNAGPAILWLCVGLGAAIFLLLVTLHLDASGHRLNMQRLLSVYEEEIRVCRWDFLHRPAGTEWQPAEHPYAGDMDVFGPSSLYQYINRCRSEQGRELMAHRLLYPSGAKKISETQDVLSELVSKKEWCAQFLAYGMAEDITRHAQERINRWLQEEETIFTNVFWRWFPWLYTLITVSAVFFYMTDMLPGRYFLLCAILFSAVAGSTAWRASATWKKLSGHVQEIATLYRQIHWLETADMQAAGLESAKQSIRGSDGYPAHNGIQALKNILSRFDLRANVVGHYFLNTLLMWDVRQVRALYHWKRVYGTSADRWFGVLAETEVWVSLAALHANRPDCSFPQIADTHFTLVCRGAGHPLIPATRRVDNSFVMKGRGQVAILTGSNMAGKSTFLRTLGTNTILAMMGAPVCAVEFIISPVQLMSSMRISDNLADSTSTFYAELKKLKNIITAAERQEKIFILMDEILRGTNSFDKHTGSSALIRQLISYNAVAVLATHDTDLGKMQDDLPGSVSNFHFDAAVREGELYFDYQLRDGICRSLNASLLMKKIGIRL